MGTVKKMTAFLLGGAAGAALQKKNDRALQESLKSYGEKYYEYFQILNRWMGARNEGKRVADFLLGEGVKTIAIYGMGDLADRLTEELAGGPVTVSYGIDRDVSCTNARIADIRSPEEALAEVDAIVITPFLSAGGIEAMLREKCACRVLALDRIIYSL